MKLNSWLKFAFLMLAVVFLYIFLTSPKNDCQSCKFDYNGKTIDGTKAYEVFEDACIDYRKPWSLDSVYLDLDDLEINQTSEGMLNITLKGGNKS